jgi:hypothetical protein
MHYSFKHDIPCHLKQKELKNKVKEKYCPTVFEKLLMQL